MIIILYCIVQIGIAVKCYKVRCNQMICTSCECHYGFAHQYCQTAMAITVESAPSGYKRIGNTIWILRVLIGVGGLIIIMHGLPPLLSKSTTTMEPEE